MAGLGAVMLDTRTREGRVWQGFAPQEVISKWTAEVGDFLICQIETYVALCMREALSSLFCERRVIIWSDNQAAKQGLVKGQSPSPSIHRMIRSDDP